MAANNQTDYAALIRDAIAQKKSDSYIQALAGQRDAKIASSPEYSGAQTTQSYMASLGYKPQAPLASPSPVASPLPSTPAYQAPQAVDNSGMINTQYGDLITALKAQIQQGVNDKNLSIGGLGAKYQPDKNASEVAKYGQVATLNEQAANAGDRGGIGRQNTLQAMVGGENRLNTINLQQGSEKTALQNDIANLMLEGNVQEAQFSAQKLKDLIANNTNMDNTNYSRGIDTANLTGMIGGQRTMAGQSSDLQNELAKINIDTGNLNLAALPQQIQDQAKMVTQQIVKGDLDIETGRAQLKELTDPNSITNQMNRLGLDTAQFNYSQLSVQAQQQAQQVANDLANGAMSRAQAQSSIDHAGDSYAASIYSTNASSANASASKTDSSNSNYGELTTAIKGQTLEDIWSGIMSDPQDLRSNIGDANYKSLVTEYNDKYYAQLKADWANSSRAAILGTMNSNPNWYVTTLGQGNYDKIVSWADSKGG